MPRAAPAGRSAAAPMSGGSEIPRTSRWRCCARGVSCLVPPLIGTRAHCGRLLGSVESAIAAMTSERLERTKLKLATEAVAAIRGRTSIVDLGRSGDGNAEAATGPVAHEIQNQGMLGLLNM